MGTAAVLGLAPSALATASADAQGPAGDQIEPAAGGWTTWVLASGKHLQLPPPPGQASTAHEITHLHALAAQRDAAALDRIRYWDTGAPGYRWNEIAIAQGLQEGILLRAYRMLALLNVAIYDATIVAWDAKYTYNRARPGAASPTLSTALPTPASPAYPCEHAVAAGAASTVLAYLFPKEARLFAAKADEAAQSRVLAGVQHPSDVAAGLDLGRRVARLVIARAMTDGSAATWTGSVPVGPGLWSGTPLEPLMGTWKTWTLSSGSEFRPGPPPAYNSAQRAAEVAIVKTYKRDVQPGAELAFWPEDPAGRPAPGAAVSSNQLVFSYAPMLHLLWQPELNRKLFEYRLDGNAPRAARAYALLSIAGYDATVACWEAKYHYWTARPNQFDPTITTVLPTYPIPDYPSGHASTAGATEALLGYLFPREAAYFASRADELGASRVWAGIHFPSASKAGLAQGRAVARKIIVHARRDGS